jgi:hypothetical protein
MWRADFVKVLPIKPSLPPPVLVPPDRGGGAYKVNLFRKIEKQILPPFRETQLETICVRHPATWTPAQVFS